MVSFVFMIFFWGGVGVGIILDMSKFYSAQCFQMPVTRGPGHGL